MNPKKFAEAIFIFLQSWKMRSEFSVRMVQYIDGKGPSRIIDAICDPLIKLRKAELSDCKRVWSWINDPIVRSVSFSPEPISSEGHKEWFSSAITDPDLVYYIAVDKDARPFGQARFQVESDAAVISVPGRP